MFGFGKKKRQLVSEIVFDGQRFTVAQLLMAKTFTDDEYKFAVNIALWGPSLTCTFLTSPSSELQYLNQSDPSNAEFMAFLATATNHLKIAYAHVVQRIISGDSRIASAAGGEIGYRLILQKMEKAIMNDSDMAYIQQAFDFLDSKLNESKGDYHGVNAWNVQRYAYLLTSEDRPRPLLMSIYEHELLGSVNNIYRSVGLIKPLGHEELARILSHSR